MFDYISALCLGDRLRTPVTDPLDQLSPALMQQLEQISAAMGKRFSQEFFLQLRGALTKTEVDGYHDGFQTGAQLMLSMLEDCSG